MTDAEGDVKVHYVPSPVADIACCAGPLSNPSGEMYTTVIKSSMEHCLVR